MSFGPTGSFSEPVWSESTTNSDTSYSASGWSSDNEGSISLDVEATNSLLYDRTETESYNVPATDFDYASDIESDATTVYSGNSHDGISTTTEGTSSTYFSISGSLLGGDAYNALPGGVAGQIGGNGLVPEIVQAEEVVPSNESVAYAEGVITLVNTYPIPSSMPADLSGSTSNLGLALIYMAVKGAGYSSVFGFIPFDKCHDGSRLVERRSQALDNMALNNGPNDGVSQTSTAPPTSVLVTLAAAGRNPTDITIPTVGGDAIDGGDGGDGSGGDHPGAEIGDGPNPPPSDDEGSHLAPAAGGYRGGVYNPFNWYRGLMTGDCNAPDDDYESAKEAAGGYIIPRIGSAAQTVGGVMETTTRAAITATGVAAGPGVVLIAHGTDTTVAGVRGLYSGEATRTMTAQGVTAATGSQTLGTVVDIGIPLVAGIGGAVQIARQKTAPSSGCGDGSANRGGRCRKSGSGRDRADR